MIQNRTLECPGGVSVNGYITATYIIHDDGQNSTSRVPQAQNHNQFGPCLY